jgi:hypothetical protein
VRSPSASEASSPGGAPVLGGLRGAGRLGPGACSEEGWKACSLA